MRGVKCPAIKFSASLAERRYSVSLLILNINIRRKLFSAVNLFIYNNICYYSWIYPVISIIYRTVNKS